VLICRRHGALPPGDLSRRTGRPEPELPVYDR
jgi:hypothetical protein